jgi:hypothetical protein
MANKKIKKKAKKAVKKTVKKVKKTVKVKKAVKKTKKITKKSVKKTISKSSASKKKKVSTKKSSTAKGRKKALVVAVGDSCFWVNYGPALRDLLELRNALYSISEEQFKHHVNEIRNDFAIWVEGVLEDKKAAIRIKKSKTVNAMIKAVEKSLKEYNI